MRRGRSLWVSLLEATPLYPEITPDIGGAFVNAMALADSEPAALAAFAGRLTRFGFRLVADHDTQPFRCVEGVTRRMPRWRAMARRARETGVCQLSGFHTWPPDDE